MRYCTHKRCAGDECRQLTPEQLAPGPGDLELAQQLVDDEWRSISTRYRRVARLVNCPEAEDVIRPEYHDHPAAKELISQWRFHKWHLLRLLASGNEGAREYAEVRELTIKQFRAFKKLGGQMA